MEKRMLKFSLLFLLGLLLLGCNKKTDKQLQTELKSNNTVTINTPHKIDFDSLTVVFVNKKDSRKSLAGKPKIVPANTNVHTLGRLKTETFKKAEKRVVLKSRDINSLLNFEIVDGDTVFFPKSLGTDKSFEVQYGDTIFPPKIITIGIPEIKIVKDPHIRDKNPNNFSTYSKLQGLKHNVIRCLFEDKLGNLWIGTYGGGVAKYDGKFFTLFTEKEGLANNFVSSIISDRSGNIWFATVGGATKYDGTNFTQFTEKQGLVNKDVREIIEDRNGDLWFGTGGGISRYNGKTFTNYTQDEGLSSNDVMTILEDSNGDIWIGTDGGGVTLYDGYSFSYITQNEGLSGDFILSIFEDKSDNIWIGTYSGVNKIAKEKITRYTEKEGLSSNIVSTILQDDKGVLWFGTYGGMNKFDGESFTHFTKNEGLPSNYIWSALESENKNLWFGTYFGLSKYDGETFTHFTEKEGLSKSFVLSILEDKNGDLWFGTDGGVNKYDGQTFAYFTKKEGLSNDFVWSMLEDREGSLWFGTDEGVCKFDGKTFAYYTIENGLSNDFIWAMMEDSKGNIWFGTYGGGVTKFDGEKFIHFREKDGLGSDYIRAILEDKSGNIWFGTDGNGATKYDGKFFTNYTKKDGLSDNMIISIIEDVDGSIWFGTERGINRYDGERFTHISEKDGLSNNNVFAFLKDNNETIFLGTRFGLNKLGVSNRQKLVEKCDERDIISNVADFQTKENDVFFKTYNYSDGFLGMGVNGGNNGNNICEATDGTIWIASNDRLTAYHANGDAPDSIPPNIQIQSVELFGEKITWKSLAKTNIKTEFDYQEFKLKDTTFLLPNGIEISEYNFDGLSKWYNLPDNLSLAYNNNNLTFNFIGITTKCPQKVKYKYFLEGAEKNWSGITEKSYASYGNLTAGTYTFYVKAMNSEGYWSDVKAFNFEIRPPWWKTWWFKSIYITLFISTLLLIYFWRTAALRRRQKELVVEVDRATQEISEKNQKLNLLVDEITTQRDVIKDIHHEVSQSIDYATRLQKSILPEEQVLDESFSEHFVLFKPKDKVSGDFYWWTNVEESTVITAADCTGHGVPGAFMSMLGVSFLREIVSKELITNTGLILNKLRKEIIKALKQKGDAMEQKDGMDMSLISINHKTNLLQYSGAYNPLYIIANRKIDNLEPLADFEDFYEIKPDKMPIAIYERMDDFSTHEVRLEKGDLLFMFSDGFADQFGGAKGKKLKYKPFKRLIYENRNKSLKEQKDILNKFFEEWKGDFEQIDDVVVIGMKV